MVCVADGEVFTMKTLNVIQTGAVVGICAFLYVKFKNSWIPGIAGAIDNIAGTTIRSVLVPSGSNELAVKYWQEHGIDQAWFMGIARGDQVIPEYLKKFLPESITVGMLYNALFNWSIQTTVGDLENWYRIGLQGSSGELISNMYQYADAILWRIDMLQLIYSSIIEENLWDVIL